MYYNKNYRHKKTAKKNKNKLKMEKKTGSKY